MLYNVVIDPPVLKELLKIKKGSPHVFSHLKKSNEIFLTTKGHTPMISLDIAHLKGFVSENELNALLPQVKQSHETLESGKGKGGNFTGWKDLPNNIDDKFITELIKLGKEVRKRPTVLSLSASAVRI